MLFPKGTSFGTKNACGILPIIKLYVAKRSNAYLKKGESHLE